jgi:hypothetical protein
MVISISEVVTGLRVRASVLPINIADQLGVTSKTARYWQDSKASSEALGFTAKTQWTDQIGLRSRWRRFESCRGAKFIRVPRKDRGRKRFASQASIGAHPAVSARSGEE